MERLPIILTLALSLTLSSRLWAQSADPIIVISSAGLQVESASLRVGATIGQPIATRLEGLEHVAELGFWVTFTPVGTAYHDDLVDTLPTQFIVEQNYPNPFSRATIIRYGLSESGLVRLTIFDSAGRVIRRPLNRMQPAGYYDFEMRAGDLPAGVYFYRIEVSQSAKTHAMILTKWSEVR